MSPTNRDLGRFLTDKPAVGIPPTSIRREFYREEFLKHWQCLNQQREYYSEGAITEVEAALTKLISQVDTLCEQKDADQMFSRLLRKIDGVTRLSAWSDPKLAH
jgi:hypothetical protein